MADEGFPQNDDGNDKSNDNIRVESRDKYNHTVPIVLEEEEVEKSF